MVLKEATLLLGLGPAGFWSPEKKFPKASWLVAAPVNQIHSFMVHQNQTWLEAAPVNRNHPLLVHRSQNWLLAAPVNKN